MDEEEKNSGGGREVQAPFYHDRMHHVATLDTQLVHSVMQLSKRILDMCLAISLL